MDELRMQWRIRTTLRNTVRRPEHALESQRKAAMARANRRMKQELEERTRKEEHELKLKEAKKQAMEMKAKELRERTKQRVAKLTAEKKQQNDEKQAKEQWEEERKKQSQAAAKSEAYKDKMVALRKETAERLRKKELRDQANEMKAQLEMQKKLTEISPSRRNHDQRAPAGFGSIHPIRSRNDSSSVVSGASRTSQAAMKRWPRWSEGKRHRVAVHCASPPPSGRQ